MATEHFTDEELACRCGCGGIPSAVFQDRLEELRIIFGYPMRLSSAYRCPVHNARVSSTGPNGPHTRGAVDVLVHGSLAHHLLVVAMSQGWSGVGVSQKGPRETRFVHLDRLPDPHRPGVWSY